MKLLLPVRRWIARKPTARPAWIDGLELTQEDIDRELLLSVSAASCVDQRPATIAWLPAEGTK